MRDLFISYAREDELRVRPLVSALEQKGWSVFWDHRIPAGQTWRSYIGRNLDEARCVIAVWSQHSVNSRWVCEEADEGQKRGILIPLLFDSVAPPMGFRSVQAADLTGWRPGQTSRQFEQLILDIKMLLNPAPVTSVKGRSVSPAPEIPIIPAERAKGRGGFPFRGFAYVCLMLVLFGVGGYWLYRRLSSDPIDRGQTEPQPSYQVVHPGSKLGKKGVLSTPGESPVPPAIYSHGQMVVRSTFICDLDTGAEASEQNQADFWWENGSQGRNLVPYNAAEFFVLGVRDFESVGYDDLQRFPYSANKVEANAAGTNQLPQGSVIAYRTKQGRLGKFKVVQYGDDLTIQWVTFAKNEKKL